MVSNIVHPISKKGKAFSFSGKSSRGQRDDGLDKNSVS